MTERSDDPTRPARPAKLTAPAIVLVRPQEEGNVGMVARAMANLGLTDLVLVEPAPTLGGVARGFGVGGWHVLDAARRVQTLDEALAPYRRVVGTTSARERPLPRSRVVDVRELAATLAAEGAGPAESSRAGDLALVFGSESDGLTRDELDRCDPVVVVPCAAEQPTLNLAQSVLLVGWELRRTEAVGVTAELDDPATRDEITTFLAASTPLLEDLGFDQDLVRRRVERDLRRLLVRARPASREVRVLRRLLNRARTRLH